MKAYMRVLLILPALLISGCLGQVNADIKENATTNLTGGSASLGGFCGLSTNGACENDSDCMTSGCSSQVCQSANDEPAITTCEYRECYDRETFAVECGCVSNQCQWRRYS